MSDLMSHIESMSRSQPPAAEQQGVTREGKFFCKKNFFMKVSKSPETDEKCIFGRKNFFFWFSKKNVFVKKKRKRIRFLKQIFKKNIFFSDF